MQFRHVIYRLFLSLAFILAASHARATASVDQMQTDSAHHDVHAQMPPCHQAMEDMGSEKSGNHKGGCCSNFACCLGLVSESALLERAPLFPAHDPVRARSLRSTIFKPLFPPPKSL